MLIAMGVEPEVAQTAVRFTFGRTTTHEDLATTAAELAKAAQAVRRLGG